MRKICFFSLLIAILKFSLVFAQTYNISQISQVKLVTEYSANTLVDQMDTVTFGLYPQSDISGNKKEPIEWIVLDRHGDEYFLLSKYILDCKCYNDVRQDKDITWENCSLRNWLNTTFLNSAFNSNEQVLIKTTNVINSDNEYWKTIGGNNTNDKLFCMSIEEVKRYFNLSDMQKKNDRLPTIGTRYARSVKNGDYNLAVNTKPEYLYKGYSYFWLRGPGFKQNTAQAIAYFLAVSSVSCNAELQKIGVRPALWITNLNP